MKYSSCLHEDFLIRNYLDTVPASANPGPEAARPEANLATFAPQIRFGTYERLLVFLHCFSSTKK